MDAASDSIVARAAAGARLLTARGAGMRLVSVASNFALIVLVTPADLGLLAVVRGLAGLAGDSSDLGFAWALLRRHDPPQPEEFRALGGVQLTLIVAFLALVVGAPGLISPSGALAGATHWRLVAVLATMLVVPWGTAARIRIERAMEYQRVAFADVSGVLLQNLTLLAFAVAGRFTLGVFVATGATILYSNLLLWFWSPGPHPGFNVRVWRRLGGEFAGFTLGHVGSLLNASATPLLVAGLFGLPTAGLWSFATRLGNVLQLAFEGFRRAAIPAAGLLARSTQGLQRLAQQSLGGAARLTLPLVAAFFAALPVVGWLLPKWAPAVPLAQLYLLGFGIAGIVGASVLPVAVARGGPRAVLAEQFAPIAVGWTLLLLLARSHHGSIVSVAFPMSAAAAVAVWFTADRSIRPTLRGALPPLLAALALSCALVAFGQRTGEQPLLIAVLAAALFAATIAVPLVAARLAPAASAGAAER